MSQFIIEAYFLNYLSIVTAAQTRLLEKLEHRESEASRWQDFHESIDGEATVTVVFSAIVLESYMLNYAARKLGVDVAEKKIDRMPLVKKWIEVPRLATGTAIAPDGEAITLLKSLVSARHAVVHLRSPNTTFAALREGKWDRGYRRKEILQAALDAVYCISSLGKELAAIDSAEKFAKLFAKFAELPRYRISTRTDDPSEEPGEA